MIPLPSTALRALPASNVTKKTPHQLAALVHEVRNPLANVNLAADMLKTIITSEDQKLYLDIIMRNSIRINNVLTDMLRTFQPDETHLEEHSIRELLDEVLDVSMDRILLKNIVVIKNYIKKDYKTFVDKLKLKIAFTNIIINAIEAMPLEKGELKLVTRSTKGKPVVEIKDNGVGIAKENIKHIFKPYFTNRPGGMGLGLSTTLDMLQSNHVRVNVRSELGKGTSFILSFDGIQPTARRPEISLSPMQV